jgi:hypothetical protein
MTIVPAASGQLSPAGGTGRAECDSALALARTNPRTVVNEGFVGTCGRAGHELLASLLRTSASEIDPVYFARLVELVPPSGVIFEAAKQLALNPSATRNARIGALRVLARETFASYLTAPRGFAALLDPGAVCYLMLSGIVSTGDPDDPLPPDFRDQLRRLTEELIRGNGWDDAVRNVATCLRRYYKDPMTEPVTSVAIAMSNTCANQFSIRNTGAGPVTLTYEVVGRPGKTKIDAPVGESFIAAQWPGQVQLRYAGNVVASASSTDRPCQPRPH